MARKPPSKASASASPEIQHIVSTRGEPMASASPLFVWRDHFSLAGKMYPIAGAHAEVVVAGDVSSRITATRVATVGVFALGAKKKRDDREFTLIISGNLWNGEPYAGVTFRFPKSAEIQIRKIAALINQLAQNTPSASDPQAAAQAAPLRPRPTPTSEVDRLGQLADLHRSGALTDDEFAMAKARLLGS